MLTQAEDFLAESEALHAVLESLDEREFKRQTAFKNWTINDVIRHLHIWNLAADLSLRDGGGFDAFYSQVKKNLPGNLRVFENTYLDELSGKELVTTWRDYFREVAHHFRSADPSRRVKWAGPNMSVRSSISARLMETWAHGQEIYDELGLIRENQDRIRNIVILGNNTYGWAFRVRGETPPEPTPHLILTAPSGALWHYNDESNDERIEGLAEEFCQVVTQVRNILDTSLVVTGPNARAWMTNAQCFAGGAQTPPAPGTRQTRINP